VIRVLVTSNDGTKVPVNIMRKIGTTSYPSLTKIANKITGAHWSGPRFFGPPAPLTMRDRGF